MTTNPNVAVARRKLWGLVLLAGSSIAAGLRGVPWSSTADHRTAPAFTVLRVAAMVGGVYLVVAVVLGLLSARRPHRRRLWLLAEACTPALIRRLADLALATGLTMAVVVPAASARVTGVPRPTMAGRPAVAGDPASGQRWPVLPDPVTTTSMPITTPAGSASPPTTTTTVTTSLAKSAAHADPLVGLRRYGPAIPAPAAVVPASAAAADPVTMVGRPASTSPVATHVVRHGESFWSIAEAQVSSNGEPADENDVATYWRQLVDTNADRLPVPGHPDLLYAGVRLKLPTLSAP